MKLAAVIPSPIELTRETLVLLGGAIIAAWLLYQFPGVGAYVRGAWNPPPGSPPR